MRVERWVFIFNALFFLVMTPIYWISAHEIAGTFALGLTGVMFLLIVGYVFIIGKKIDPRPEDDKDAEIYQSAGAVNGFFPGSSIWPFWCALSLAVILVGAVFGGWISILGVGLGVWAASGWVFQYYRGDYAH